MPFNTPKLWLQRSAPLRQRSWILASHFPYGELCRKSAWMSADVCYKTRPASTIFRLIDPCLEAEFTTKVSQISREPSRSLIISYVEPDCTTLGLGEGLCSWAIAIAKCFNHGSSNFVYMNHQGQLRCACLFLMFVIVSSILLVPPLAPGWSKHCGWKGQNLFAPCSAGLHLVCSRRCFNIHPPMPNFTYTPHI